jgi:hypothetical protein
MRWMGYVASMGEMRNYYKILICKTDTMRPLGRLRHNGRMDLKERGRGDVEWIYLAQDREQ